MQAEVICRPVGIPILHHRRNTKDISLGGMRVFSDQDFEVGQKLELTVLLHDGAELRCWAEVVWLLALDAGAPARFDVGLKFTDMDASDIQRLASAFVSAG